MDDDAIRAAFPNSPQLLNATPPPVDPVVREAYPASPEMFPPEPDAATRAAEQRARWVEAVRAEYGSNLAQALQDARGVVTRFGDADLKAALDASGLGSHPAVVRFVAKVAAAMKGR